MLLELVDALALALLEELLLEPQAAVRGSPQVRQQQRVNEYQMSAREFLFFGGVRWVRYYWEAREGAASAFAITGSPAGRVSRSR